MSNTKLSLSVFTKLLNERMKLNFKGYLIFMLKAVFTLFKLSHKSQQQASVVPSTLPWLLGLCKLPLEHTVLHHV